MTGAQDLGDLPVTEGTPAVDLGALAATDIAVVMLRAAAGANAAIEPEIPAIGAAVEAIADRMAVGGRLVLVGAGTSGRLALMQASEVGPTFDLEPGRVIAILAGLATSPDPRNPMATDDAAEDDGPAGSAAIADLALGPADAVVGISASGRTPYTLAALQAASQCGALTVALACDHPSPLARVADIAIHPRVGAEVLAGSTRLAAGTATKTVLDILTTGVMARIGRIHEGRMIDLRAANAKLRDRATRIVADLAGTSEADARITLESVGWSVRVAVVRLRFGLDPAVAIAHGAAHPFLADALASPPADGALEVARQAPTSVDRRDQSGR